MSSQIVRMLHLGEFDLERSRIPITCVFRQNGEVLCALLRISDNLGTGERHPRRGTNLGHRTDAGGFMELVQQGGP